MPQGLPFILRPIRRSEEDGGRGRTRPEGRAFDRMLLVIVGYDQHGLIGRGAQYIEGARGISQICGRMAGIGFENDSIPRNMIEGDQAPTHFVCLDEAGMRRMDAAARKRSGMAPVPFRRFAPRARGSFASGESGSSGCSHPSPGTGIAP